MEEFVKGNIVVFSFPFSDYTSQKRRPALVVATPQGNELIVCQITSKTHFDFYSIDLEEKDFFLVLFILIALSDQQAYLC